MSIIKIVLNSLELDFVKESLTIKKENNSLISDFKVAYSSVPFLIIENKNTKQLLGPRDITSINKIKTVDVKVIESGIEYYGILQVISYLNGYRKCNLKYSSELLTIIDRKIADFMPIVSIIAGESDPAPFLENSESEIAGYEDWQTYPLAYLDKCFPDVKWQFPTMNWRNRYGIDLQPDETWFLYNGLINAYNEDLTELIQNYYEYDLLGSVFVYNPNVIAPQVFLLSPLFYALQSIGWKLEGDFPNSEFVKRILLLSTKTNMTEVALLGAIQNIIFEASSWTEVVSLSYFNKVQTVPVTETGTYKVSWSFTYAAPVPTGSSFNRVTVAAPGYGTHEWMFYFGNLLTSTSTSPYTFEGSFNTSAAEVGSFTFMIWSKNSVMPTSYTLTLQKVDNKIFQEMHPTIQTGRFVPDWSFGTAIKECKNFFNLDVVQDDFTKTLTMNFNKDLLTSPVKAIIRKSLNIESFDQTPYNAFLIKYGNDEDTALWIDTTGVAIYSNQKSDFVETIQSKFKFVPHNTVTAELSEELEAKDGVGLMIYDPVALPFISSEYASQNLTIHLAGGIYDFYFKIWLKFRINASIIELQGPFTEQELASIVNQNKIYIDRQEYIIEYLSYSETDQSNFLVKFKIHSVTI